jgi:hypothetical protein
LEEDSEHRREMERRRQDLEEAREKRETRREELQATERRAMLQFMETMMCRMEHMSDDRKQK